MLNANKNLRNPSEQRKKRKRKRSLSTWQPYSLENIIREAVERYEAMGECKEDLK